jgi:hypothetical protein
MPDGFRDYVFTIRPYTREARVTVLKRNPDNHKQLNITAKFHLCFNRDSNPIEFSGSVMQEVRGGLQEVVIDDYLD